MENFSEISCSFLFFWCKQENQALKETGYVDKVKTFFHQNTYKIIQEASKKIQIRYLNQHSNSPKPIPVSSNSNSNPSSSSSNSRSNPNSPMPSNAYSESMQKSKRIWESRFSLVIVSLFGMVGFGLCT